MTLYTSVIKDNRRNAQRTALIYLAASILCAVFGAVYEVFSHGVYSYYMIYAFAFPLILGTLPFLLLSFIGNRAKSFPGSVARCFYHSAIIVMTVRSIMTGILEIYGTTNQLLSIYWFAGAGLLLAAIISYLISLLARSRNAKTEIQ